MYASTRSLFTTSLFTTPCSISRSIPPLRRLLFVHNRGNVGVALLPTLEQHVTHRNPLRLVRADRLHDEPVVSHLSSQFSSPSVRSEAGIGTGTATCPLCPRRLLLLGKISEIPLFLVYPKSRHGFQPMQGQCRPKPCRPLARISAISIGEPLQKSTVIFRVESMHHLT